MGLLADAVRVFKQGLETAPDDLTCLLGLARALMTSGKFTEASPVLRKFLQLKPNHPEVLSHLARIGAKQGDAASLELLRKLSARDGAEYPEHYNLGMALMEKGELAEAEVAFTRASNASPQSVGAKIHLGELARRRGDFRRAISFLEPIARSGTKDPQPVLLLARARMGIGAVGPAIRAYRLALDKNPTSIETLRELTQVLIGSGQPKLAIPLAAKWRDLRPSDAQASHVLGLAQFTAGMIAEARLSFESAIEEAPSSWETRIALARLEELAGSPGRARNLLEEAREVAPDQPGPIGDLALLELKAKNVVRAQELLAAGLAKHPENPELSLNMALATADSDPAESSRHARAALKSRDAKVREQAQRLLAAQGAPAA